MLSRQLNEWKDAKGVLTLSAQTTAKVEKVLDDCVSIAWHLENSRVQRPVVIDLSDPKIALFPIARRPIPAEAPETAAPIPRSCFDDDGAA
ncbi:hypothetical protein SIAM614_21440 [Stappia aggregata IAM 12614]|uniref:Uncharacterized protein n=2 Tax=Roseibium aggregatum TaxID=187304 RepID=A0P3I8_ROSAI|nr:hypothetical protein SIAM614_21440 [Stappia aggregata IAM 12614] [Roseibium aggregatum IAM 12614]